MIKNAQTPQEKRAAYACDITYGTNNEFGFDYLRDNLAYRLEERVQRTLSFAVVDEVDSILIDEARTPLIISGPAEESTELYLRINELVPRLTRQKQEDGPGDFAVEEKTKQVHITEAGHEHVEQLMLQSGLLKEGESLYDPANIRLMHHLNAALRAHALYKRDVEYIVRGGEVIIVDEFTGRTMPGRRWSDGLHQAVEAKEGVRVREENQTVASITFQNYFRLYQKLSGMTGTADTEAPEFMQIYGLEVVVIPTHRPMIRKDNPDFVYLTQSDKFKAIIEDIRDCVVREQPVLVGTTSIETSEFLSGLLQKENVAHQVLNAKQHEREAHIVAQAGRPGTVTIATNMAGRGTDIVLGGNLEAELAAAVPVDDIAREQLRTEWQARHDKVLAAGGLHIVGTERHESRRIDNQLRGRSGRQGDPGSSRFYLSMEDNLMRIFGDPVRTQRLLKMAGMKEGEVIESGMLTRQIEKAQRKVESHNFDIRKNLLLFDDVANDQRKVVYSQRTEIMGTEDLSGAIHGLMEDSVGTLLDQYLPRQAVPADWDLQGLAAAVLKDFNARIDPKGWLEKEPELEEQALRERVVRAVHEAYDAKVARIGAPIMRHVEKQVMLQKLDQHWREHLAGDGLPAAGHSPARLCAEGLPLRVQARGLRAVRRHARAHQVRDLLAHGDARGTHPGGDRARGGGAPPPPDARAAGAARRSRFRARPRRRAGAGGRCGPRTGGGAARAARRVRTRRRAAAAAAGSPGHLRAQRAQGRPQRAVPVRLGQEVQALSRRAQQRRIATRVLAARSRHRARARPRGGGGAVESQRAGADRAASAGQAPRRPLGVSRRQGGSRRERARCARARAARGARCRSDGGSAVHASQGCLRGSRGRAVAMDRRDLQRHAARSRRPAPQMGRARRTCRRGHSRGRPALHRGAARARPRRAERSGPAGGRVQCKRREVRQQFHGSTERSP